MIPDEIKKLLDAERAALAPEKVAALEASEAMKAMLAAPATIDEVVTDFAGVKVKHHRFLTKKLRLMMGQIQGKISNAADPVKEQDTLIYQLLSEVCTEDPMNDPDFWKLVDIRFNDGRVYTIFFDLMLSMGGDEKNLKSMQKARKGSTS